MSYKYIT